jgi:hypothetical protein
MISTIAAVLAAIVARRSPAHRHLLLAWATTACASSATEWIIRAQQSGSLSHEFSSRCRLTLALLIMASQAWAVRRTCLGGTGLDTVAFIHAFLVASTIGWLAEGAAWVATWPVALAASTLVELHAVSTFYSRGCTPGVSHRVARVMALVDTAGVLLGAWVGFDHIGVWGNVGAAAVASIQALWLQRVRATFC